MTLTRVHIASFLLIGVGAWAGVLYLQGNPLSLPHFAPFGTVVTVLAISAALLDRVLWRLPLLNGTLVKRPNLRGTWRVLLTSNWEDPETGESPPPITCFMGVEQTLSTLHMHLMTSESESWFIAHSVLPSPSGSGFEIVGVYRNQPRLELRGDRSEMHHGALVIHTHGPDRVPTSITGEYWTDRRTTGRMEFSDRVDELATRFSDAAAGRD